MRYLVKCISSEREYEVEAKNAQQAKKIVCKQRAVSPSDYWCGLTNYSAKKINDNLVKSEE